MMVKKDEEEGAEEQAEEEVGTHWESWSGGHRDWRRVQSGGSSGWSSARSHGTVRQRGDSQTGCEGWTVGTERPPLG